MPASFLEGWYAREALGQLPLFGKCLAKYVSHGLESETDVRLGLIQDA
jgi:hypothetical protein